MVQTLVSRFFFSLKAIEPSVKNEWGTLTYATSKEVPGLSGISFSNLLLKKNGFLRPIWHPNAHKIGYCTQGKCLITLRSQDKTEIFTVENGEMFFVPQGFAHHIHNYDETECLIHFALDHTLPETMSFEQAIYSISDSVFNATFNTSSGFVDGLKKSKNRELIIPVSQTKNLTGNTASAYKFNIGKSEKTIATKGGYLQLGVKKNLSLLQGLGILGFGLNVGGVVEPHWHTNAGELVYIVKGHTKITILSPDGNVETLEVNGGEGAFAPASYFHNIENIGQEKVEVIAFFSHAEPDYMGIGEVAGAFSNEDLGALFGIGQNYFKDFKKPQGPLVIVPT